MKSRLYKRMVEMDRTDVAEMLIREIDAIKVMVEMAMVGQDINSLSSDTLGEYMGLILNHAEDAGSIADELLEYMMELDRETEDDMEGYAE